jgi:hypothetical protein
MEIVGAHWGFFVAFRESIALAEQHNAHYFLPGGDLRHGEPFAVALQEAFEAKSELEPPSCPVLPGTLGEAADRIGRLDQLIAGMINCVEDAALRERFTRDWKHLMRPWTTGYDPPPRRAPSRVSGREEVSALIRFADVQYDVPGGGRISGREFVARWRRLPDAAALTEAEAFAKIFSP